VGNSPPLRVTDAEARLIGFKVRQLIGKYGFTSSDVPDLHQELTMHVHQRVERHDVNRGARSTFMDRLVSNKIASIIEHRTAMKRDVGKERELDPEFEPYPTKSRKAKRDQEHADLVLDVAAAIPQLPRDLRKIARQLMHHNKAEVGRAMHLSPQQMKTAVARIAEYFRQLNISLNSETSPTNPPTVPVGN